jgi:hypothetical protein
VDKQTGNQKSININYGKSRLAGIETRNWNWIYTLRSSFFI